MGCLIGVLTGLAIVLILFLVFFFGFPKSSRNLSKYEALLSDRKNLRTGFVAFPAQIPVSALENDPEFYYFYQDTLFDPTAEVYLRCSYDEADFNAELDRLEHYQHTLQWEGFSDEDSTPQTFLRDEEGRFSYPAYIAIYGDDHACEYALITGEREITYVYFAFKKPGNFRAVPDDCLPQPFVGHLTREEGQYNIYSFPLHDKYSTHVLDYGSRGEN